MKKSIIVFLILTIFVKEQIKSQELTIGIRGGTTTSGLLYSKFFPAPERRFGFLAGVTMLKPISHYFDFGTELIYEQKGYIDHIDFTDENGSTLGTEKYIFMLDYLVLPCYLRLHTTNKIKWFVNFGLYPSYLISSKANEPYYSNDKKIRRRISKFNAPSLHHFDIGGLIGGGAEFKITEKLLIDLNLRYENGFLSVFDKGLFDQYMLLNSLNFSIGLNYKIK